jgi:Na+/proline symporter
MENLYLYIAVYVAILIGITLIVRKKESEEDFLISGRNRSTLQILLSKFAGAVGAGWFITYTAFTYQYGTDVFGAMLGGVISYVIFGYWAAPKIHKYSKEHKFYTQGDFVKHHTKSEKAKFFTNAVSTIGQFSWVLVGLVGGAKIMSHFSVISYEAALIITALVVLFYLLVAGFKAVILTDFFQSLIIFVFMAIFTFALVQDSEILTVVATKTESMDLGTSIGFLLYGLLAVFAYADRYQLCYAAKDEKSVKRGMAFAIIPVYIVLCFILVIGLYVFIQNPNLDPDLAFLEAMRLYLPAQLLPFAIILFFAGLMSTADTNIYATASHFVLHKKKDEKTISKLRTSTVVVVLLGATIAFFYRDIVGITILAASFVITLSIPMIYILAGKTNPHRFLGSLTGALGGFFLAVFLYGPAPEIIGITFLGGLLGLLYNRKPKHSKREAKL